MDSVTIKLSKRPEQFSNHGTFEYRTEVRDAGVMGKGVFATKTIKKGTVAAYYDGIVVEENPHMCASRASYFISNSFEYSQGVNGAVIAGFPEQIHPGGIGQLCNDATTSTDEDERKKYGDKYNVTDRCINGSFVMVPTRKIRKGEQLFYDYGIEYWRGKQERLKKLGTQTVKEAIEIWLRSKLQDRVPPEVWTELMGVMEESYEGEKSVARTKTTRAH